MKTLKKIQQRNSARILIDPKPSDDELNEIYKAALRAPDHAWLRPTKFIQVMESGLDKLSDIFEKVALSHTYYGVIPFENSHQGVINSSLNGLIDYDLKITKELNFKIIHSFCSKNVVIENVTKIASHPQVFGQCNDWLKRNYPSVEKVVCTSTAEAAEMAKHDSSIYCIANDYAKDLFGLNMHETNIQDSEPAAGCQGGQTPIFVLLNLI